MKDSPVNSLLKELIYFDKKSTTSVYIQISQQIINAIQRRYLKEGTALPGTRILSQLLNIHRNTAAAVYDELAAQGWVEVIPNKGTFILFPKSKTAKIKALSNQIKDAYSYPKATGFPFNNSFHLSPTEETSKAKYILNDGHPDLRLHNVHEFSKWYSASMKRKSLISKWKSNTKKEFSNFEKQLCNFLNSTRGFHIKPNNLLSTRSTEMSLYVISRLLIKRKDVVLVGNLSNYNANMIFQEVGADIKTIPFDENGLDINYIEKHFTKGKIRCVYVCSNRDYPTTNTLSAERRLHLLQLAKKYQFAIIEDDFDYDFQLDGSAMLPMASSDGNGMVIYLGKLGQSLFPSFQTGFVVAPENVISEAKNYLQILDKQGDLIQEQLLSELIYEGEIYRLLKKNIVIYKRRRDYTFDCFKRYFNESIQIKKPSGGLAIWIEFQPSISLVQLAEHVSMLDVFLPKTLLYQDKNTCAIRFGFGHLNEEEIEIIVSRLKQAYNTIK
ncbi:PLP-dependent aminotransferase family protein [Flavobacterium sp. HXWNR69]|uniref:PLP-dependent aminotransferase family protein n=1 Tax=Flavobacterium fragile TaxID=2949085 RepID=A0ABT0TF98_9FLAO|nr:PLP-dependent aminotransferase family protein [Flavobacterium sp. HXWNR69]MCL9769649.1 PLP-dependent aminotransferase family protein [Flavobacterium sp. HXWNR69]